MAHCELSDIRDELGAHPHWAVSNVFPHIDEAVCCYHPLEIAANMRVRLKSRALWEAFQHTPRAIPLYIRLYLSVVATEGGCRQHARVGLGAMQNAYIVCSATTAQPEVVIDFYRAYTSLAVARIQCERLNQVERARPDRSRANAVIWEIRGLPLSTCELPVAAREAPTNWETRLVRWAVRLWRRPTIAELEAEHAASLRRIARETIADLDAHELLAERVLARYDRHVATRKAQDAQAKRLIDSD